MAFRYSEIVMTTRCSLRQATVDDALAAHFERTIAIAANGLEILTQV